MNELRILQDGNKSLWLEGSLYVPRFKGIKAFTLDDLLAGNKRGVIYADDLVGRVDDAEFEGEEEAWIQAELQKRSKWLDRIRYFAERKGLNLRALLERLQPGGLRAVEIAHRPGYYADLAETLVTYQRAGIEIPPAVKALLVYPELSEVAAYYTTSVMPAPAPQHSPVSARRGGVLANRASMQGEALEQVRGRNPSAARPGAAPVRVEALVSRADRDDCAPGRVVVGDDLVELAREAAQTRPVAVASAAPVSPGGDVSADDERPLVE
jgi:hypothetical protein